MENEFSVTVNADWHPDGVVFRFEISPPHRLSPEELVEVVRVGQIKMGEAARECIAMQIADAAFPGGGQ